MKKRLKKIPKFKTEDEEREFWWSHDSTDYIDWSKAKRAIFPNLKLTDWGKNEIKVQAKRRNSQ